MGRDFLKREHRVILRRCPEAIFPPADEIARVTLPLCNFKRYRRQRKIALGVTGKQNSFLLFAIFRDTLLQRVTCIL